MPKTLTRVEQCVAIAPEPVRRGLLHLSLGRYDCASGAAAVAEQAHHVVRFAGWRAENPLSPDVIDHITRA